MSGCKFSWPPSPPPPPAATNISACSLNSNTGVYSCNINFKITDFNGYSQIGGASIIAAKPK